MEKRTIAKDFLKFSSRSILAHVSMSFYYIVDTFFIAKASGGVGLAAIGITSPVYYLIYAFAAMLSTGSSILFRIKRSRSEEDGEGLFSLALILCLFFSLPFVLTGLFWTGSMVSLFGGSGEVGRLGKEYIEIVLMFSPLFMVSHVVTAFLRNDDDPDVAMGGTLLSSLFNIVADYVLMFPLGLGLRGAALATVFSPVISLLYSSRHFLGRRNSLSLVKKGWSLSHVGKILVLGIEGFSFETTAAVTIVVFNWLLLLYGGESAVAAYGIIANAALFVREGLMGLAEGGQPLFSWFYGKDDKESLSYTAGLSLKTALLLGSLVFLASLLLAKPIAGIFVGEGENELLDMTARGLWMYFSSFVFASLNIVVSGYCSATNHPYPATVIAFLRGLVLVVPACFFMAILMGVDGIWLSLSVAEALTFAVAWWFYRRISPRGV